MTIPDKLTSRDDLFEGVLRDVVETPEDKHQFIKNAIFYPQGFPIAETRNVHSKQVVQVTVEAEKLEWMNDVEIDFENIKLKDCHRFDLQGNLITEFVGDSTLFHHGTDPHLPGYTISELIHLSKSTVPTQRVIAFRCLICIVNNSYNGKLEIHEWLSSAQASLLLATRIGLDSNHTTVVDVSLQFLQVLLGSNFSAFSVRDKYALSVLGKRSIAQERITLTAFGPHQEVEDDLVNTMEDINNCLSKDPILGLLMTNIVVRLRYLFHDGSNNGWKNSIVLILSSIALHSQSSAEDILSCSDLVNLLTTELVVNFKPSWYLINLVRLIRYLSQSSREATLALSSIGRFDSLLNFLALELSLLEPKVELELHYQVLLVFEVLFSFGAEREKLEECWILIYGIGKSYCDLILKGLSCPEVTRNLCVWIKILNISCENFGQQLFSSSSHLRFAPCAELLLVVVFKVDCENSEGLLAYTLKFFQTLMVQCNSNFAELFVSTESFLHLLDCFPFSRYLNIEKVKYIPAKYDEYGVGLLESDRIRYATSLTNLTISTGWLSIFFDVLTFAMKRKLLSDFKIQELMRKFEIIEFYNWMLDFDVVNDWIRYFGSGVTLLVLSVLNFSDNLKSKFSLSHSQKMRAQMFLMYSAIPGDDWALSIMLNTVNGLGALRALIGEHSPISFKALYTPSEKHMLPALLFQKGRRDGSSLPLENNWLYSFPITASMRQEAVTATDLCAWLEVFEQFSPLDDQYDEVYKLFSILNVFLLKTENGDELYHEESVKTKLGAIFPQFTVKKLNRDLDSMQNVYLELIDVYKSTSYGDPIFSKYLLLPCVKTMSISYRQAFWTKMRFYFHHFHVSDDEIPFEYFETNDRDQTIILNQQLALAKEQLPTNSILWKIAKKC